MQIIINIQIFVAIIIFIFTKQIEIYSWLMIFALIHELGHMFMGLALKNKPQAMEIQPFGFRIVFESFANIEKNKIIIALAGPSINIIIAIIFIFINTDSRNLIINSNLLLAFFNLIPIYPLDGGRIIKSIITINSKQKKAEKIINKISNILMIIITIISSVLILFYKNIGLFLIIIYLWAIVIKENNRYILKKRIENIIHREK